MKNALVAIPTVALLLVGCGQDMDVYEEETFEFESVDDNATTESALSGTVTVGSTLKTTANLNLRTGASTGYAVITVMPSGSLVKAVAASPSNGFYKVSYGSSTGWASGSYLALQSTAAASSSINLRATDNLNLRSGPSTSYGVLTVIPNGTTISALSSEKSNGYYNVTYAGYTGWAHGDWLTSVSSSTQTSSSCPASVTPRYCSVPYIAQMSSYGTADDWNAASNCGPTSVAMIARAFHYRDDLIDGSLINHLGTYAGVGRAGAGYDKVLVMAKRTGQPAVAKCGADANWIKSQLSAGRLVAVNGNRVVTLKYDNNAYNNTSGVQGHWIVAAGIASDGAILIKDPSVSGISRLQPYQMNEFMNTNYNGNCAVAVGP